MIREIDGRFVFPPLVNPFFNGRPFPSLYPEPPTGGQKMELPRGIRNNNPGNLRPLTNDTWRGEVPPDTGATPDPHDEMGSYSRFSSPEFGIRALIRDCRRKRRRGLDTIFKIKQAFAPASDGNDVEAYAASVARMLTGLLGVTVTARGPLPEDSVAFRIALAKATVRVECGDPRPFGRPPWWYDDAVYERAAAMEMAP